jgi:pimeloyl-ACP methyl ester carboxylesterase
MPVLTRSSARRRRLPRAFAVLVAAVLLVGAGAAYQAYAGSRDAHRYRPPGELVDVGTHRMHLYCTGAGSPTVVLDHASGSLSAQWALVQPRLALSTRVCSYDRSGYGWSEDAVDGSDVQTQARELRILLERAGERGPFVHVGHSSGAFVGTVLAAEHPELVAGLVMVEPGYAWGTPGVPRDLDEQVRHQEQLLARVNPWAARSGLVRLLVPLLTGGHDLPPTYREAYDALVLTSRLFLTSAAEIEASEGTSPRVLAAQEHLGVTPVVVLSAQAGPGDRTMQAVQRAHAHIAAASRRGEHHVVPGTDHMGIVLRARPAAAVAERVQGLVVDLRARSGV